MHQATGEAPSWMLVILACALTLALVLSGCASTPAPPGSGSDDDPTLHVINDTSAGVRVYYDGRLMGNVVGPEGCVVLDGASDRGYGQVVLKVTAEDPFALPSEVLGNRSWVVRVGPWQNTRQFDAISFRPAARCDP